MKKVTFDDIRIDTSKEKSTSIYHFIWQLQKMMSGLQVQISKQLHRLCEAYGLEYLAAETKLDINHKFVERIKQEHITGLSYPLPNTLSAQARPERQKTGKSRETAKGKSLYLKYSVSDVRIQK